MTLGKKTLSLWLALFCVSLFADSLFAQISQKDAVEAAKKRMAGFKFPADFKIKLYADSSQIVNPSAFYFDSKGRLFVCEIHRWRKGVDDIRHRPYMLFEDIAIQTNADRLEMFKNHKNKIPMSHYTKESSVIKLLEDTNMDGRADKSTVFADNFRDPLDGPGIGVIERDNKVYYTNIPHLWMLEDTNGDGKSDVRKSIQDGFGTRMSFSGHDMHGLIWGPDGKLYWSIGDRGFSLNTKEGKKFHGPNEGAVFRCDPDGSNVELFYERLRNPQELAFDEYGNLFTADNDSDKGDVERVNYLVEGGDTGWHAGHQAILTFQDDYKFRTLKYAGTQMKSMWFTEKMFATRNESQPAFILPGIGKIVGGPSGFTYNPANSLGPKFDKTFFVIIYKGSPNKSNISTFKMDEDGAGFVTKDTKIFMNGINTVDVDFGPDGRLYVSEYNYGGWLNTEVGNVYSLAIPEYIKKPEVAKNHKLLISDFTKKSTQELVSLFKSNHMHVRQRAQFALAKRGGEAVKILTKLASQKRASTLERIHAIWGLGQMAKGQTQILKPLLTLITDQDTQVRIQSARVLGDHKVREAIPHLTKALKDKHARVGMYAGIGLGRIGVPGSVPEMISVLKKNDGKDLFLQHGMIMGMQGLKDIDRSSVYKYMQDQSDAVRMAILLVLRRWEDARISHFLNDKNDRIFSEAVRAINDRVIEGSQSALASSLSRYLDAKVTIKDDVHGLIHSRIINANYYHGKADDAARLLKYAANTSIRDIERMDALACILAWQDLHPMDSITGLPRKYTSKREVIDAQVKTYLPALLADSQGNLLAMAMKAAAQYGVEIPAEALAAQMLNAKGNEKVRIEAMQSLFKKKYGELAGKLPSLFKDKNAAVRVAAMETLVKLEGAKVAGKLVTIANKGGDKDRQTAIRLLGEIKTPQANQTIESKLDQILAGKPDEATMLEVLAAANASSQSSLKSKAEQYKASLQGKPLEVQFHQSLRGGDVNKGQSIFFNHGAAQCLRCHKVQKQGADVGPNLTAIAKNHDDQYLLQSIVNPAAVIAPGYGMVSLTMKNGDIVAGQLMQQNKKTITLKIENKKKVIQKSMVKDQTPPVSGMPPMNFILKPAEVRDLVAYLGTLKGQAKKGKKTKKKEDGHE